MTAPKKPPAQSPSVESPEGEGGTPLPEGDSAEAELTDEQRASLALLHFLNGKAYCGRADDPRRTTIAMASALVLEKAGLIELQHRPTYVVAVLVESEVSA